MDYRIEEIASKACEDLKNIHPDATEKNLEDLRKFLKNAEPTAESDLTLLEEKDLDGVLPKLPLRKLLKYYKTQGWYNIKCERIDQTL